jgi:monooxygenase
LAAARPRTYMSKTPANEHLDVIIVGAGLSGIAAAYHLKSKLPGKEYMILEGREAVGGTWDLFRYPGIRSDSDIQTLGYGFRPWLGDRSIVDGASIAHYIRETASVYGIDRKIKFGHRVVKVSWSSAEALWTVEVLASDNQTKFFNCRFLFMCCGYYDYSKGYLPNWPKTESYKGTFVHPQHWPEDLNYNNKRVLVIGSGATAVTLVPAMAEKVAHITMLQRSPTYVVSRPAKDFIVNFFFRILPPMFAHTLARWKNMLLTMYFYNFARIRPARTKKAILHMASKQLGKDYDVHTHFNPRYNPWDQRLCIVPDGDLFAAIRSGKVSIVTDEIECFTETGLLLRSGKRLDADVIVTATGLNLKLIGGADILVDGEKVDASKTFSYKGMMLNDVPNLAFAVGYTNASWTLKCELVAEYVCRLLKCMDKNDYAYCTPRLTDETIAALPPIDLTSGYIKRSEHLLPRQGSKKPWKLYQNYALDLLTLRFCRIQDGVMEFSKAGKLRSSTSLEAPSVDRV